MCKNTLLISFHKKWLRYTERTGMRRSVSCYKKISKHREVVRMRNTVACRLQR